MFSYDLILDWLKSTNPQTDNCWVEHILEIYIPRIMINIKLNLPPYRICGFQIIELEN